MVVIMVRRVGQYDEDDPDHDRDDDSLLILHSNQLDIALLNIA